jgi:hypothetical protein
MGCLTPTLLPIAGIFARLESGHPVIDRSTALILPGAFTPSLLGQALTVGRLRRVAENILRRLDCGPIGSAAHG